MTIPSTGNPGGGGGIGGGGSPPNCALHTKLIKTNKIEANFLLFCVIILRKSIKKSELTKNLICFSMKKYPRNTNKSDEPLLIKQKCNTNITEFF